MVEEAQAFVEGAGGNIVFARAEVHVIRAAISCVIKCCLHQSSSQTVTAQGRNDIQLCQVALKRVAPDRRAESQYRQTVRASSDQQDRRVAGAEKQPDPLGQLVRVRSGFIELAVEVIQQPANGLGIVQAGVADCEISVWIDHEIESTRHTAPAQLAIGWVSLNVGWSGGPGSFLK
jgi:hypothetical protein